MQRLCLFGALLVGTNGACADYPDCSSCAAQEGCAYVLGRTSNQCTEVGEKECVRGLLNCANPEDTSSCKDPDNKYCANINAGTDGPRFELGTCTWLQGIDRQSKKFCSSKETCSQCQNSAAAVKMNSQMKVQRFDYYGCGWFAGISTMKVYLLTLCIQESA